MRQGAGRGFDPPTSPHPPWEESPPPLSRPSRQDLPGEGRGWAFARGEARWAGPRPVLLLSPDSCLLNSSFFVSPPSPDQSHLPPCLPLSNQPTPLFPASPAASKSS